MRALRLIFAGSGEFGAPTLRRLIASEHQIVQVASQPDRPAGRGRQLHPTPIAQLAMELGLPLIRTGDIDSAALPDADLMIVIAFGQKIGPGIVNRPRLGSINLHGSRVPHYRGAAPVNWAIINGDTFTGNSVIRLAERMDAGAVLAQSRIEIGELETAGELHDRLAADGVALVLEAIDALERGDAKELPQDESQATRAPKLGRKDSIIDWSHPASRVASQIRGMFPWPGCRVRLVEPAGREVARVTLTRARACEPPQEGPAGSIATSGQIFCRAGGIEIVELQPEGKRPMSLAAFRNGHRWEAGMRLESIS